MIYKRLWDYSTTFDYIIEEGRVSVAQCRDTINKHIKLNNTTSSPTKQLCRRVEEIQYYNLIHNEQT